MMNMRTRFHGIHLTLAMVVLIGGWTAQEIRADDDDSPGAVYTLGNAAAGNALVVFQRDKNGGLSLAGTVDTGGLGTGSGLGSQGSLALRGDKKNVLYAVNAGSNQITVFKSGKKGPKAVQLIDSAGLNPISVTARENTLYVLNAGSSAGDVDQITGFRIDDDAHLRLLPNSTQGLRRRQCRSRAGRVSIPTAKSWWSPRRTPTRLTPSSSTGMVMPVVCLSSHLPA